VILNVLMTKMVADWFAGREISTAMGIFVNSYPVGIAVALVAQPFVAEAGGVPAAFALTSVLSAAGCAALLLRYRPADGAVAGRGGFPRGRALGALLLGASVWGLYNAALLMVISFGPILLHGRGWALDEAGSATSLSLWVAAAVLPFGGLIADRTGQGGLIIVAGCGLSALVMAALPRVDSVAAIYGLLILNGLVAGLPPGPIMSLPARVLTPETRALGMGLFFSMFYLFMFLGPPAAGALLEASGWDGAALDLGGALLIAAIGALVAFNRVASRV
jgi:sugar phosphate permease